MIDHDSTTQVSDKDTQPPLPILRGPTANCHSPSNLIAPRLPLPTIRAIRSLEVIGPPKVICSALAEVIRYGNISHARFEALFVNINSFNNYTATSSSLAQAMTVYVSIKQALNTRKTRELAFRHLSKDQKAI